jgi:hypothetical protein
MIPPSNSGFDAMIRGEGDVVSGFKNNVQSAAANVTPAGVLASQHRKMGRTWHCKEMIVSGYGPPLIPGDNSHDNLGTAQRWRAAVKLGLISSTFSTVVSQLSAARIGRDAVDWMSVAAIPARDWALTPDPSIGSIAIGIAFHQWADFSLGVSLLRSAREMDRHRHLEFAGAVGGAQRRRRQGSVGPQQRGGFGKTEEFILAPGRGVRSGSDAPRSGRCHLPVSFRLSSRGPPRAQVPAPRSRAFRSSESFKNRI